MTLYVDLIKTNIVQRKTHGLILNVLLPTGRSVLVIAVRDILDVKESLKSVIHTPTDLKFEEYATVGDELQFTYVLSDSEITASTAKPNDIPNNSNGNHCDCEQIEESPVSMNPKKRFNKKLSNSFV
ncbi:hypothetical protein T07_11008 [Trichinella nelsoni]|uniref:Uncharacterized protein n=1 Tax=Trichinella nelsoni TaxID=6336 RepID=A0A0V0S931_9BILA|nr:hypothetical protein T07_11008 [Trichinella nelsoni]